MPATARSVAPGDATLPPEADGPETAARLHLRPQELLELGIVHGIARPADDTTTSEDQRA